MNTFDASPGKQDSLNQKIYFIIKKPTAQGKGYSIFKETRTDQSRTYQKVSSEPLDSVNHQIKLGTKSPLEYLPQVRNIVTALYDNELKCLNIKNDTYNFDNIQILDNFWKAEYESRNLVDAASARYDFYRAIKAVGKLSLISASKEQLQNEIARKHKDNNQRRITSRLNTILKFLNRNIKLRKDKPSQHFVKFITEDDFLQIIPFLDDPVVLVISRIAFYSGARLGEVFGITKQSLRNNHLYLFQQMDRHCNRRNTKNRISRIAWVFRQGKEDVTYWANIPEKENFRKIKFAEKFRVACKKAFPDDSSKWCGIHDLRHSYAINLLSKGVSLGLVAQSLGNSITVCQRHYTGFVLSDDSMSRIDSLIN